MFCALLSHCKISGGRLQDHWSSSLLCYLKFTEIITQRPKTGDGNDRPA